MRRKIRKDIWVILGRQDVKPELLPEFRLNVSICSQVLIWHLKGDTRNSQPEGAGHEKESHLSCHQRCHTQHLALPTPASVSPALPGRCHGDLMWILHTDPISCPSPPFSVPFNFRAPDLFGGGGGNLKLCFIVRSGFSHRYFSVFQKSLCQRQWTSAAWWDTASQHGLCPGLTSVPPQGTETMVVFSGASELGNQTLPTALNPLKAPSDPQIDRHLQYFTRNTSTSFFILCPASGWISGPVLYVSEYLISLSNIRFHSFLPPFVPFILIPELC